MHEEKYNLDDSLGYLTGVAHWKLHKKLFNKFSESGLNVTPDQWKLLASLAHRGDMYQSQLAKCHKKDRAGVKRLIDHLETKGLVIRLTSEEDTRTNIVKLTDKGEKVIKKLNKLAKESMNEAVEGFSESELALLKRLLITLINNNS